MLIEKKSKDINRMINYVTALSHKL